MNTFFGISDENCGTRTAACDSYVCQRCISTTSLLLSEHLFALGRPGLQDGNMRHVPTKYLQGVTCLYSTASTYQAGNKLTGRPEHPTIHPAGRGTQYGDLKGFDRYIHVKTKEYENLLLPALKTSFYR